jgi:transposase
VLAPTLAPGDIVVMDNLPPHKTEDVRAVTAQNGAQLFLLAPYSPELNRLENA